MQKAREKLMKRDKEFARKFAILRELREKQAQELKKPFEYKNDNNYYIIHPNHIQHYVDFVDDEDNKDKKKEDKDKNPDKKPEEDNNLPNSGDKKTIIYHDVEKKNVKFPNELLIQH